MNELLINKKQSYYPVYAILLLLQYRERLKECEELLSELFYNYWILLLSIGLREEKRLGGEGEYWSYEYDLLNRLTRVSKSDAGTDNLEVVAEYVYDHNGYRVKKTRHVEAGTEVIYYVFGLSGEVLYKEQEAKDRFEEFVYVAGKYFAKYEGKLSETGVEKYFYHTDHLGSVTAMTDEGGSLAWSQEYMAFGQGTGVSGLIDAPNVFTGKELDEDVGLYYFAARWYSAELGRFITEDPVKDGGNWYVYCGNNPLGFVDPTGLDTKRLHNPLIYMFKDRIGYQTVPEGAMYHEVDPTMKYTAFPNKVHVDAGQSVPYPYFYFRPNCMQRLFGYFDDYDWWAENFIDIQHETIRFNYNDRSWKIEFWKGVYPWPGFISTGAEIGIYVDDHPVLKYIFGHDETATNIDSINYLEGKFELINTKTGETIMIRNTYEDDLRDPYGDGKTFWIVGFNKNMNVPSNNLMMISTLIFDDPISAAEYVKGLQYLGYTEDQIKISGKNNNIITFTFDKPKTPQNGNNSPSNNKDKEVPTSKDNSTTTSSRDFY